jgi:hypothetical protein
VASNRDTKKLRFESSQGFEYVFVVDIIVLAGWSSGRLLLTLDTDECWG